ncbi:hypothetical protein Taro_032746 [Colocasia esculenta]|uniref:Uncharacterized protein n=1 Tax=Colocasia esculenta TaxID=4460 RepID=A0A843VVS7_COLES|nr:hypothetical protein [Colocasia esculenta]
MVGERRENMEERESGERLLTWRSSLAGCLPPQICDPHALHLVNSLLSLRSVYTALVIDGVDTSIDGVDTGVSTQSLVVSTLDPASRRPFLDNWDSVSTHSVVVSTHSG